MHEFYDVTIPLNEMLKLNAIHSEFFFQYHVAYSMVRYNVRKFSHLKDVVALLKRVIVQPRIPFYGLGRGRPPTESELQDLLLNFDRAIMASAIESMEKYIKFRDEYWTHYNQQNGIVLPEKKKTRDRR